MKIHLAQIPEEGLRRSVQLELGALTRLSEVIGAQTGQLVAELRIRNRDGNVEIVGSVRAHLNPPCQRCLEPVPLTIEEPVRVALAPERDYEKAPEDTHLGQGELEVSFYAGEELDLGHILEDELLLLLPEPVAEEDEHGRCVVCGRRSDEVLAEAAPGDSENHPFAQLKGLLRTD
jgi:uncharacterized protein